MLVSGFPCVACKEETEEAGKEDHGNKAVTNRPLLCQY